MKNLRRMLWGLVFLAAAVIIALNSFDIIDFDLFFDGWWTLFIIIPSFVGIVEKRDKTGSIFGLLLGIFLLLCAQDILSFEIFGKLLLPAIIAYIGIKMISSASRKNKAAKIAHEIKVDGKDLQRGVAAFSGTDMNFDGVAFDGGKAEKYELAIGSNSFIPGFEAQIIGHNIGESFDITVKFPEEYHSADLAGKDAIFKIVLHGIKKNELPELDDEFAKDVSEFDTIDEYKADIKAKLEKKNEKAADNSVEEQIINALIENLEAEIPAAMFESEAENFVRDYDSRLRMQGLDLQTYCKYTGQTLETLREQFKPMAERQVKTRLALEKIVELEAIDVTEEEIEAEFENLATAYGMKAEEVKKYVEADAVKADLCVKKAVDFVKENADITIA